MEEQEKLNEMLIVACKDGSLEEVKELIERGADVNAKDNDCKTALMYVSQEGYIEIVEYLVTQGAKIDEKEKDGTTSLMYASQGRHEAVVGYLVSKGAKVDDMDGDGATVLMYASVGGSRTIVEYFTSLGVKIDEEDKNGNTAMMHASRSCNQEVVEYLISKGAKIDKKDNEGFTALSYSTYWGMWFESFKNLAKILIEKGADIEERCYNNGWTSLIMSSWWGEIKMVDFLLNNGADIEAKDNDSRTPLMHACIEGHEEVVSFLVKRGANLQAKDKYGNTSLIFLCKGFYGAFDKDMEVINILEVFGANIRIKITQEMSEKIFSLGKKHLIITHELMKINDNNHLLLTNNEGKNILQYASANGFIDTVNAIIKELNEKHLKAFPFLNNKDKYGHTALSLAANYGHAETVKLLLDNGAEPYIPNKNGDTALFWAMARGHEKVVESLKVER